MKKAVFLAVLSFLILCNAFATPGYDDVPYIINRIENTDLSSMAAWKGYGFAEMQGRRQTMEDAHHVEITKNYALFGLYDGHGGREVADYAAQNLHKNCVFTQGETDADIIAALKKGFVKTHEDLDKAGIASMRQGCTAMVAYFLANSLYVANAGDTRAVLCRAGNAMPLSEDHKPDRPGEKKRIEDLGGSVYWYGVWRVNGNLAVSRALGDKNLNPYVTPDPEITHTILQGDDAFLIIACDGVWDMLSNQEAVDVVKAALQTKPNDFKNAAAVLRDAAYNKGSTDNISVIVVGLNSVEEQ